MDNVSNVLPKAIGFPKLSKLLEKTTVLLKITEKKSFTEGQSDENMTAEKEHDVSL